MLTLAVVMDVECLFGGDGAEAAAVTEPDIVVFPEPILAFPYGTRPVMFPETHGESESDEDFTEKHVESGLYTYNGHRAAAERRPNYFGLPMKRIGLLPSPNREAPPAPGTVAVPVSDMAAFPGPNREASPEPGTVAVPVSDISAFPGPNREAPPEPGTSVFPGGHAGHGADISKRDTGAEADIGAGFEDNPHDQPGGQPYIPNQPAPGPVVGK